MLGIRFIKFPPTTYVLRYANGKVVREGAGLSFFYYSPTSSLVAIPVASTEAPFIFNEVTADFQEVTIQGQTSYRITDAKKIASLLNFTLDPAGKRYVSDDPEKLPSRVINAVRVLTRKRLQHLDLRQALHASEELVKEVGHELQESKEIVSLGLEILGLSILAIRPNPETARALEAEVKEQLLKEADNAVYARRTTAVEQERAIKESELNTEIAVENKKRQIREAQMDAERAVQQKQHELREAEMASKISLEQKNKDFVILAMENAKQEADAKAYSVSAVIRSIDKVDPKVLQALASMGMKPDQLIALAFQEMAERADKIGQLNVSPDLLRDLLGKSSE